MPLCRDRQHHTPFMVPWRPIVTPSSQATPYRSEGTPLYWTFPRIFMSITTLDFLATIVKTPTSIMYNTPSMYCLFNYKLFLSFCFFGTSSRDKHLISSIFHRYVVLCDDRRKYLCSTSV